MPFIVWTLGDAQLIESEAKAHVLLLVGFSMASCRPTGGNLATLLNFERNLGRTDFEASADEYDVTELCVSVLNQLRWLTIGADAPDRLSRKGFGGLSTGASGGPASSESTV